MHVFKDSLSLILCDDSHGWHGNFDPECVGSIKKYTVKPQPQT